MQPNKRSTIRDTLANTKSSTASIKGIVASYHAEKRPSFHSKTFPIKDALSQLFASDLPLSPNTSENVELD